MDRAQRVSCGVGKASYDIVVGHNFLTDIPKDIQSLVSCSKFVLLTDSNVFKFHGQKLLDAFQLHNIPFIYKILPPGEASKCRETKSMVEEWMLKQQCQRDTCIVAFGGGVVGDLAGFIAATYMRGLPFVQIPTTLLACVDSSIGGKTGIDSPSGKNLIGAFHQPKRVFVDLSVLQTLPERELVNGMAEIIKAGAIKSEKLFELLERHQEEILTQKPDVMLSMVLQAAEIKAKVVTQDEKEGGLRAILNFGHSIGHGIEALLQPHFLHGECVAIGMVKEAELARLMGMCSSSTIGRLVRCIKAYGLPTRIPTVVSTDDVMLKMQVDKKNAKGVKRMILLESIGQVYAPNPPRYAQDVQDHQVELIIERQICVKPGTVANGTLRVPGSKSISNRVLLLAALGAGTCRIHGLLHSDDTQVMLGALQILGAKFEWEDSGNILVVHGTGGKFNEMRQEEPIYLSNAGTAYRFLTTCATLVPTNSSGSILLTGNSRMKERPIGPLVSALVEHGCSIEYVENEGFPPLRIKYTGIQGGSMRLAGKVSSQYVSSVLISAPYAKEPLTLQLEEEHPTSLPYILMTTQLMKQFGLEVQQIGSNTFVIPTGVYQNPSHVSVEVDASSATYPLAIAAITGGQVTVEGLGSGSLQGDAQFHTLLGQMGCESSQTDTSTIVKGPSSRLRAVKIDMETMTDAFMTAVALAAVADGKTEITGISNQRVKECNRIEVMVTELTKMGVKCGELPDGIWVEGVSDVSTLKPVAVECHNDHRIAMSFAVLGCAVSNVIITDKECTDKTYSEFWDDCQTKLGLTLQPVTHRRMDEILSKPADEEMPCVFAIGMRGVGKTTLCRETAQVLNLKYLDMDDLIEQRFNPPQSIKDYVKTHGWASFRQVEADLLRDLTHSAPSGTLIGCGGGVIETPSNRQLLSNYPYVIYLHRDTEQVLSYLRQQEQRPDLNDDITEIWNRRKPLYEQSSQYEFKILAGTNAEDWKKASLEFARYLNFITGKTDPMLKCVDNTFFLSLTYPDLNQVLDILPQILEGVHAIELRVDLLKSHDKEFILSQIALLRRHSELPIIYTARSKDQGGGFDQNENLMFDLLQFGLRSGCEFVDMECCWSFDARERLIQAKRSSAIIASYHAVQEPVSESEIRQIFIDCYHNNRVDIVKVVVKAFTTEISYEIHQIAQGMDFSAPIIALCTTEQGKLSRVLNKVFTPVTHPLLPIAAAPGQLSVNEIMTTRQLLGLLSGNVLSS